MGRPTATKLQGPVLPAHRTGGHRAVETAAAQLALPVMGAPGNRPHPPAAAAAPFGPRGTDRAQRLTGRPAAVDHLDLPTAPTGGGIVAGATAGATARPRRSRPTSGGPARSGHKQARAGLPPGPGAP